MPPPVAATAIVPPPVSPDGWVLTAVTFLKPQEWRELFTQAGYKGDYCWTILEANPEWNDFNRDIWTPLLNKIWNNEAPAKEVAPELARQTTDAIKNREKY